MALALAPHHFTKVTNGASTQPFYTHTAEGGGGGGQLVLQSSDHLWDR